MRHDEPPDHDAILRRVLAIDAHVGPTLRALVAPELAAIVDWERARRFGENQTDADGERCADLVFVAPLRDRPGRVAFLVHIEHQSTPDETMPLRFLEHALRLWRQQTRPLTPIVPILITNTRRPWTGKLRFAELFDLDHPAAEVLREHVPDFRILLEDLVATDERQLLRRPLPDLVQLVFWALRVSRVGHDRDLVEVFAAIAAAIPPELEPLGEQLLRYLLRSVFGEQAARELLRRNQESTMTRHYQALVQQWKAEGVQEGIEKGEQIGMQKGEQIGMQKGEQIGMQKGEQIGMQKGEQIGIQRGQALGARSTLLQLLRARFGDLPPDVVQRVEATSLEQIQHWTPRVLDASSPEQVVGDS